MEDDFLSDEFVLDDVPVNGHGPTVVFTGPSEAPPALRAPPAPAPRSVPDRTAYVLFAMGLSAAAAVVAIIVTRQATRTRDIQTMSVESAQPVAAATAGSEAAPAATPAASSTTDAAERAAEDAKQAKQDAQGALEKGHAVQAIEAGERSVALDPTDAEAWLILGAGYEQRGAYVQARRCFATCAQVATRGPRRECAALLR